AVSADHAARRVWAADAGDAAVLAAAYGAAGTAVAVSAALRNPAAALRSPRPSHRWWLDGVHQVWDLVRFG
ncbi:unnamed protein product, partial [Polarella glacialis]